MSFSMMMMKTKTINKKVHKTKIQSRKNQATLKDPKKNQKNDDSKLSNIRLSSCSIPTSSIYLNFFFAKETLKIEIKIES